MANRMRWEEGECHDQISSVEIMPYLVSIMHFQKTDTYFIEILNYHSNKSIYPIKKHFVSPRSAKIAFTKWWNAVGRKML